LTASSASDPADVLLVGAGLSTAILALRLAQLPDPPRVVILERSTAPFGDKTWSLQATDISDADRAWLSPAFLAQWPRQAVRFPDLDRELATGYVSLSSATLRDAVTRTARTELRIDSAAIEVDADGVTLADGSRLTARCVIDARGHGPDPAMRLAYQKFVGWTVETATPHGIAHPVIMDATVPQIDGFRFVYLLPFSETRILIEDTRYSDYDDLDEAAIDATIQAYADDKGWHIAEVAHRESGVLPITLAFDRKGFWADAGEVPRLGMRAGLFHATTGYSLPDAVRAANLVAGAWPADSAALARRLHRHARRRAPVQAFYRFLNRTLFLAAPPDRRHLVMQKFYTLPQATIERFYAGRTTLRDIALILSGRPPVPIHRAIPCIVEPRLRRAQR